MQTFTYVAHNNATGQKISAEVEAQDERAASKLLVDRGLSPLSITPKQERAGLLGLRNHIPTKQKVIFSRQLSTLINAGLPLSQSLNTVRTQTKQKAMNEIIGKIIVDVEAGSSLANALRKYPDIFNSVYISLVEAGESSGTLDKSLERLATQQEKDSEVISKLRGALIYPAIVVLVLIAIVIFMTTTVLPQVSNLYQSLPGAHLPFLTVLMLDFSKFITRFWWLAIIVLVGLVYFTRRFLHTAKGKSTLDELKIKMWPSSTLFMKLYMSRFSRTAATLVNSGVPMIQMLNTTAEAIGNTHIAASVYRSINDVKDGKTLSSGIQNDPHFLDLVPQMISIGEQSGTLGTMLERLADYYEKEVESEVKTINTIIEPALMVVVGIVALIIVAAVLLPIYGLAGQNLSGQ